MLDDPPVKTAALLLSVVFSLEASAQGFRHCPDPLVRRRMSILEAAIAGPPFSERDFVLERERFDRDVRETEPSPFRDDVVGPDATTPLAYLRELETQSLLLMTEAVTEMMWEIHDPSQLRGSVFRADEKELPRRAVSQVCQAACPSAVRERLVLRASRVRDELKAKGVPRRDFGSVAEDLEINRQGLRDVLIAAKKRTGGTTFADYWAHLRVLSTSGLGRLWQTETGRTLLGLPLSVEALDSAIRGREIPALVPTFDRHSLKRVVAEYYHLFLYGRIGATSIYGREIELDPLRIDESIVEFYRLFPLAVARLAVERPDWSVYHCRYLGLLLSHRGEGQASKVAYFESSRLLSMSTFWLVGLGSAILIRKGRIAPVTFSIVGGIQLFEIAYRTAELRRQASVLDRARLSTLSGQMDPETFARYLHSLQVHAIETSERNKEALEELLILALSFTAARAVAFGLRGTLTGKVSAQVLMKKRYQREIFDFLSARGVVSHSDLKGFLARATPEDLRLLRRILKNGYEYSAASMVLSLKEVWSTFSEGPVDVNSVRGEL